MHPLRLNVRHQNCYFPKVVYNAIIVKYIYIVTFNCFLCYAIIIMLFRRTSKSSASNSISRNSAVETNGYPMIQVSALPHSGAETSDANSGVPNSHLKTKTENKDQQQQGGKSDRKGGASRNNDPSVPTQVPETQETGNAQDLYTPVSKPCSKTQSTKKAEVTKSAVDGQTYTYNSVDKPVVPPKKFDLKQTGVDKDVYTPVSKSTSKSSGVKKMSLEDNNMDNDTYIYNSHEKPAVPPKGVSLLNSGGNVKHSNGQVDSALATGDSYTLQVERPGGYVESYMKTTGQEIRDKSFMKMKQGDNEGHDNISEDYDYAEMRVKEGSVKVAQKGTEHYTYAGVQTGDTNNESPEYSVETQATDLTEKSNGDYMVSQYASYERKMQTKNTVSTEGKTGNQIVNKKSTESVINHGGSPTEEETGASNNVYLNEKAAINTPRDHVYMNQEGSGTSNVAVDKCDVSPDSTIYMIENDIYERG